MYVLKRVFCNTSSMKYEVYSLSLRRSILLDYLDVMDKAMPFQVIKCSKVVVGLSNHVVKYQCICSVH